jgi:hypothetical protein
MPEQASVTAALKVLLAQVAVFQALLLAATALHKAVRWRRSLGVMQRFAGVPRALSAAAAGGAIATEVSAAVLLAVPTLREAGAALAAVIWSVYLALIVRAIVQDRRDVDCGCSFGPNTSPLGGFHIARNVLLMALAVLVAGVSARGGVVAAEGSQLLAGFALLALYGAVDQVMGLQPLRRGEVL